MSFLMTGVVLNIGSLIVLMLFIGMLTGCGTSGDLVTLDTGAEDDTGSGMYSDSDEEALPTYYVSNDGDDSNSGTSISTPWETLSKVNSFDFSPGDVIGFERGGTWRGQLIPHSGDETASIHYTAYGTGDKPLLLGSIDMNETSDWIDQGGNIWATDSATLSSDIGNIILDNSEVGIKCSDEADLDAQNEFWYDSDENQVKMYSSANPADLYESIELAQKEHVVNQTDSSHIIYSNLHLMYGAAHGFGGGNTQNITIKDCEIDFVGGGYLTETQRYGNGIELWGNAENILIEGCKISNTYDTGIVNNGSADQYVQRNIRYKNNHIFNCEVGFEIWGNSTSAIMESIYLEDNVFEDSGFGWSADQRPDPLGYHIVMWRSTASAEDIFFTGNTFSNSKSYAIDTIPTQIWNDLENIVVDDNTYIQPENEPLIRWNNSDEMKGYTATDADFQEYQNSTGNDTNSTLQCL
jgi:hypothetical protein